MVVRLWQCVVLCAFVTLSLSGCTGHYKFDDQDYRPVGEPLSVNRGK